MNAEKASLDQLYTDICVRLGDLECRKSGLIREVEKYDEQKIEILKQFEALKAQAEFESGKTDYKERP